MAVMLWNYTSTCLAYNPRYRITRICMLKSPTICYSSKCAPHILYLKWDVSPLFFIADPLLFVAYHRKLMFFYYFKRYVTLFRCHLLEFAHVS